MTGRVQVKDGIWYTIINIKESDGKYKPKWQSTGLKERGNKKEANRILDERIEEFEKSEKLKKEQFRNRAKSSKEPLGTANALFVDYCKAYIESIKNKVSAYVYVIYSKTYMKTFKEYFKDKKVIDITKDEIEGFYEYMQKERGVKNVTLKHYTDVLRPALRRAFQEDKIIPDNPFMGIASLSKEKPIIGFYNKNELDKLFETTRGHKFDLAYRMLAHYGLRRSELLGLRWKAIDFDHNTITVNHKVLLIEGKLTPDDELKTATSYRTLPLILHIKKDLLERKQEIEENRQFFGSTYNKDWLEYVFVEDDGRLMNPEYLSIAFREHLKKHKLKHIRLHDLRHSCASLLLANGINLKQIQEWLGHADFSTTANVYSHLDYSGKMQAANILTEAFGKKDVDDEQDAFDELRSGIISDMKKLSFTEFSEYAQYLKEQRTLYSMSKDDENRQPRKKSDMEM